MRFCRYRSLSLMHPELLSRIDALEDDKGSFVALQEKLEQIRATWAQLEEVKKEQIRRAEEMRREQEVCVCVLVSLNSLQYRS